MDDVHTRMLVMLRSRVSKFVNSASVSRNVAKVRSCLCVSAIHEFPDLNKHISRLLREAANHSRETFHTDLRHNVIVECLKQVPRDRPHQASCVVLAVANEWTDVNWGSLYVVITEEDSKSIRWKPISVGSDMMLTDVYVTGLSVASRMGRCSSDEMRWHQETRGKVHLSYRTMCPVPRMLSTHCIWRTGMTHCASAAHICSTFSRSSVTDLEQVLDQVFNTHAPAQAFDANVAIGRELRKSINTVRVGDVADDMIMVQGQLLSRTEFSQIKAGVSALLWPDFAKYVLMTNAPHVCTMTLLPVRRADAFYAHSLQRFPDQFVHPACRQLLSDTLLEKLRGRMDAEASVAFGQLHTKGAEPELDPGLMSAWAGSAPAPFADSCLRELLAGAYHDAPIEVHDEIATFRVHVLSVYGVEWRVPELLPTTIRASDKFREELIFFMGRFRPGCLNLM